MKLTNEIRQAISRAVEAHGSQNSFAKKAGVKHQNISRYLNGGVTHITPKMMAVLWPHIKDYLPADFCTDEFIASDFSNVADAELEILKRDAKIAQLVLQVAYLERKIKRLRELNGFERDIKN